MAKNKRKAGKSTILIIILVIIYVSLLTYFSYNKYNSLKTGQANNKVLTKALVRVKEEYEESSTKNTELVKEISDIEDTKERITKTREDVFTLASQLEKKIENGESSYKIAYLTFDDGPYYNTYKVLNILKEKEVQATFFTTNVNGTSCYDHSSYNCQLLYKEYPKGGHTIANHTYTHAIWGGLYSSTSSFINAIKNQENLVKEQTGYTTNIIRFPGGSGTSRSILGYNNTEYVISQLRDMGYGWVDWSAQDGDGGYVASTDDAWGRFSGSIDENIEVVLFHDYSGITTAILPRAIDYLRDKNYILLPLFHDSVKVNK